MIILSPPRRPAVVTLRVIDVVIGFLSVAITFAAAGYVIGLGEAATVAERAEAVAVDAEATLAQARALCGGGQ